MKNNPFLTVFILICIEIMLYVYFVYADFEMSVSEDFILAFFCFLTPGISILLNFFTENYPYKKAFRIFTIFLVVISIIVFSGMWYLFALAKAFQH